MHLPSCIRREKRDDEEENPAHHPLLPLNLFGFPRAVGMVTGDASKQNEGNLKVEKAEWGL